MLNNNLILTGHCGLIGEALSRRLKIEGYNILYEIDSREGFNINSLNSLRLNKKTEPVGTMIHLASYCKINECINEPELPFENNVRGTYNVLEFCRKNEIPKIIFTSSSRVLSKEKNPYTASKVYGEELIKAYHDCYGIKYVIIRPSTVYGKGHDVTSRLITEWIIAGLRNKELPFYGNENKTLDFTYIDDFVDGFVLTMGEKNKEFDISGEQETKLTDLAEIIKKETGGGYVKFYPAEIAQPQKVNVDISDIKKLGYKPKVSLEEGVKRVVNWYKKYPKYWRENEITTIYCP